MKSRENTVAHSCSIERKPLSASSLYKEILLSSELARERVCSKSTSSIIMYKSREEQNSGSKRQLDFVHKNNKCNKHNKLCRYKLPTLFFSEFVLCRLQLWVEYTYIQIQEEYVKNSKSTLGKKVICSISIEFRSHYKIERHWKIEYARFFLLSEVLSLDFE